MNNMELSCLSCATIRLLKAVPYMSGVKNEYSVEALKYGVLIKDYDNIDKSIVECAVEEYGLNGSLFNQTFHGNFAEVKETSEEVLFLQEILHYMTTYGTDFTSDYVYIPSEAVNIPNVDLDKIKLVNISTCSMEEIGERLLKLVNSGVALSNNVLEDVITIGKATNLKEHINEIKNREVRIRLYDEMDAVPSDADEFLRLCLYLASDRRTTLKIKDRETLTLIKDGYNKDRIQKMFAQYIDEFGFEPLVKIFKQNKDLFVCLKRKVYFEEEGDNLLNSYINKISKLSKKKEYDNSDKKIENVVDMSYDNLGKYLDSITPYREIAILNYFKMMLDNPKYLCYNIRNGKTFIKENDTLFMRSNLRLKYIKNHLVNRLRKNFENKSFCIPRGIDYALPTSEKKFCGNLPDLTKFSFEKKKNLVVAVAWETECDIDFAMLDKDCNKIGWNGSLKGENILFSGDMTRLVNGKACEAFYIENGIVNDFYMTVNLYSNRSDKTKIPFKLIVAQVDDMTTMNTSYIINPNDVVYTTNLELNNNSQLNLGVVSIKEDVVEINFNVTKGNDVAVSASSDLSTAMIEIIKDKTSNAFSLGELITLCGGMVFSTPTFMVHSYDKMPNGTLISTEEKAYPVDYDLSLENLSKDTILKLLTVDN